VTCSSPNSRFMRGNSKGVQSGSCRFVYALLKSYSGFLRPEEVPRKRGGTGLWTWRILSSSPRDLRHVRVKYIKENLNAK
jgi:hypothetical protein